MKEVKTLTEILNGVSDKIYYSCSAEQLASLALTKFAEQITEKGATILSCSPKQIKLNNGDAVKVVGKWLKYTYNFETLYYIQFDDNPFFSPTGYKCYKNGQETFTEELPNIFDGVNKYLVEENNIQNLVTNIFISERYLSQMNYRTIKPSMSCSFDQHIYYSY